MGSPGAQLAGRSLTSTFQSPDFAVALAETGRGQNSMGGLLSSDGVILPLREVERREPTPSEEHQQPTATLAPCKIPPTATISSSPRPSSRESRFKPIPGAVEDPHTRFDLFSVDWRRSSPV